jgi:hypothetical protein
VRSLAGLAFGLGCNGAVQACWLLLLVMLYGSLDIALREMKPSAAMQLGAAAYFASLPASFLGGLGYHRWCSDPARGAAKSSSVR